MVDNNEMDAIQAQEITREEFVAGIQAISYNEFDNILKAFKILTQVSIQAYAYAVVLDDAIHRLNVLKQNLQILQNAEAARIIYGPDKIAYYRNSIGQHWFGLKSKDERKSDGKDKRDPMFG